jgi:hypothetical protein
MAGSAMQDHRLLRHRRSAFTKRIRPQIKYFVAHLEAVIASAAKHRLVASLRHKELSSSGLTGRSSMPRPLDLFTGASGILDHPLEPVIGLTEGETRWRVTTT